MRKNDVSLTTGVATLHVARAFLKTAHIKLGHSFLYRSVFTASRYDHPLPRYSCGNRALQTHFSPFLKFLVSHVKPMARTFARAEGAPLAARCPNFNTTFAHAQKSLMQNFVHIGPAVFELLTILGMTH